MVVVVVLSTLIDAPLLVSSLDDTSSVTSPTLTVVDGSALLSLGVAAPLSSAGVSTGAIATDAKAGVVCTGDGAAGNTASSSSGMWNSVELSSDFKVSGQSVHSFK